MSLGMSSEVAAACVHCSELLCLQLCWSKQYWLQCSACAKTSWRTFLEKYGRFCSLTVLLHCSYSPEFCFAFQTRASLLCWMQNIFNVSVCFEMTCIEYKLAYLLCGNGGRCWHMLIRPFTCSCCTNWAQNVWAAFKERSCFSCWTGHAHQSLLHHCLQPLNSAYTLDSELQSHHMGTYRDGISPVSASFAALCPIVVKSFSYCSSQGRRAPVGRCCLSIKPRILISEGFFLFILTGLWSTEHEAMCVGAMLRMCWGTDSTWTI